MKTKTPILLNAAEMVRQHPSSFVRPHLSAILDLKPGDTVKVCDGGERFWVAITAVDFPIFTGAVDSLLIFNQKLRRGDLIKFHANNVYDIYEAAASPA